MNMAYFIGTVVVSSALLSIVILLLSTTTNDWVVGERKSAEAKITKEGKAN